MEEKVAEWVNKLREEKKPVTPSMIRKVRYVNTHYHYELNTVYLTSKPALAGASAFSNDMTLLNEALCQGDKTYL